MSAKIQILPRWARLLATLSLFACSLAAQSINFGAYSTSQNIVLNVSGNLNFNNKEPVIASGSNQTVSITLSDNEAQYITITGDATRDVTVSISAPIDLMVGAGGPGNQIPLGIQFAYSNLGSPTPSSAKDDCSSGACRIHRNHISAVEKSFRCTTPAADPRARRIYSTAGNGVLVPVWNIGTCRKCVSRDLFRNGERECVSIRVDFGRR